MNKSEFILQLRNGLSGLPQDDVEERLNFYGEMIDDRIEDGLSEEDAVLEMGNINKIISQILAEIPLSKIVKKKITAKTKPSALTVVLLILGSPIWLSLAIVLFAIIFSLFVVLWSVAVVLWSVFVSFLLAAVGTLLYGIITCFLKGGVIAAVILSSALIIGGLSVFMFYISKSVTKLMAILTRKTVLSVKKSIIKRGEN